MLSLDSLWIHSRGFEAEVGVRAGEPGGRRIAWVGFPGKKFSPSPISPKLFMAQSPNQVGRGMLGDADAFHTASAAKPGVLNFFAVRCCLQFTFGA